jgi:hypothetical protein
MRAPAVRPVRVAARWADQLELRVEAELLAPLVAGVRPVRRAPRAAGVEEEAPDPPDAVALPARVVA